MSNISFGIEFEFLVAYADKPEATNDARVQSTGYLISLKNDLFDDHIHEYNKEIERQESLLRSVESKSTGTESSTLEIEDAPIRSEIKREIKRLNDCIQHAEHYKDGSGNSVYLETLFLYLIARKLGQESGLPIAHHIKALDEYVDNEYDLIRSGLPTDGSPVYMTHFCVKRDSTVGERDQEGNPVKWAGVEITTPVFQGDAGKKEMGALWAALKKQFRTWINHTCEMHIHISPFGENLTLEVAQKAVALVWLMEKTLRGLIHRGQEKMPDTYSAPIGAESNQAKNSAQPQESTLNDQVKRLLPDALYNGQSTGGTFSAAAAEFKPNQLACIFETESLMDLCKQLCKPSPNSEGTDLSRNALAIKLWGEGRSATIELRGFPPTTNADFAHKCVGIAAAILKIASMQDHGYKAKLTRILHEVGRDTERWSELLDILDLGDDKKFWEAPERQFWKLSEELERLRQAEG